MSNPSSEPHPLDTRRQPKPVTVTIEGEQEDLQIWFQRLYHFLGSRDEAVDFDYRAGKTIFRVYPRAIND